MNHDHSEPGDPDQAGDDGSGPGVEPDPMEAAFDDLRLSATGMRMVSEDGQQLAAPNTGNPQLDALLGQAMSGLISRTNAFADEVDGMVEHYHPLYLEDKRAGRVHFQRDDEQ